MSRETSREGAKGGGDGGGRLCGMENKRERGAKKRPQRERKEPSANILTGLAWHLDGQVSEQMV